MSVKKATEIKKTGNSGSAAESSVAEVKTPSVTSGKASNVSSKTNKAKKASLLQKLGKIEKLPKTVQDSIPVEGFLDDGIFETSKGTFTRSYYLEDINFNMATDDEQLSMFSAFSDLLNSFNGDTRFQFSIFNHKIDKKEMLKNIKIPPQKDGLNKYRQELNTIFLDALKKGNSSIAHDKYLTISIDETNVEKAVNTLIQMDKIVQKSVRDVTKKTPEPLSTYDRMKLLYDIYNQGSDYRLATGLYDNGSSDFDVRYVNKSGLSVKDLIAPTSLDFSGGKRFKSGDTYGQAFFLKGVPSTLSTDFIKDISDLQCNLLISIYGETIETDKAIRMLKNESANIDAQIATITKRNMESGLLSDMLPPKLQKQKDSTRELMDDVQDRNQKLFLITFTVVLFAKTLDELNENIRAMKSVAAKHVTPLEPLDYQQEAGLNSALPLCRGDLIKAERLYTTESASVFIPFNSEELMQSDSIFYGQNQVSKNMIMYNRLTGSNYNGLIFGFSGSGKSFTAKEEMTSVILSRPNAQVFVIDPQGEYYPLAKGLRGAEIVLSPGSTSYINPLDLDITEDKDGETDPVTMKSDYIMSLFEIIIGKGRELSPAHKSILDRCVRKLYRPYLEYLAEHNITFSPANCPTLTDLYGELTQERKDGSFEAGALADVLEQYAVGSFNTFARRTNVETNKKFMVYNTKTLGTGMKELGLYICINDIWNRMIQNSKKGIETWFYIDEFHVLLESDGTTAFLKRIWKMARKWLGVPTGIMQNTEDLLRNQDTRAIFNNTNFIIMLKEPKMDRENLMLLLNLSNAQIEYINESKPGHGLLYNGKVTLPFGFDFPKETALYKLMSTSHDVDGTEFV